MYQNNEISVLEITSKENLKVKNITKLKQKKYREELNKFAIENWKIIQENVGENCQCREIFATKKFSEKNEEMLKKVAKKNYLSEIYLVSEEILQKMSSLDSISGILATYEKVENLIDLNSEIIVYLNAIKDPGNLGTILRSAMAFGIKNVILDEKCVDLYNEKTLHSSKGVNFKLNILIEKQATILKMLQEKNYALLVTDVNEGKKLTEIKFNEKKICLVLGNESFGVDEEIVKMANEKIIIPTAKLVESLNVSVSAGIIFYDIFQKDLRSKI